MKRFNQLALALVASCLTFLTGCSASNCDVEVYLDPELKAAYGQIPTLEVDIAGVNAEQAQRLQQMNLDQYFTPNSPQRKSLAPLTLRFSEENPGPMILADNHELWKRWEERGAQFVAVICNLPQFLSLVEDNQQNDSGASQAPSGMLAGAMAEMANENSAVFNDGRVLLINMHDGFFKDSSEHLVQISVDGLLTLKERPEQYLEQAKTQPSNIRTVQDLKRLEQQEQLKILDQAVWNEEEALAAGAESYQNAPVNQATKAAQGATSDSPASVRLGGQAAHSVQETASGVQDLLGAPEELNDFPAKVSFPQLGQ